MIDQFYKSRRLRLNEGGFRNYTGHIGLVEFVDGVSVSLVGWRETALVGSLMAVEDADIPGYQVGPAADALRSEDMSSDTDAAYLETVDRGLHVNAEGSPTDARYTREELEAIADKEGLAGVRELARRWGRTGRSVRDCLDAILDAQGANPVLAAQAV